MILDLTPTEAATTRYVLEVFDNPYEPEIIEIAETVAAKISEAMGS